MMQSGEADHGNQASSNGANSRAPLIWAAIGGLLGYSGAPVEGSGVILALSTVAGAALLWAVTNYKEEGVRLAGTRNPYATDRESLGGLFAGLAFPLTFLSLGMLLTFVFEAGAGLETNWVPILSALLGLVATGFYQGRVLRTGDVGRRTAPWAFVYLAHLLFIAILLGPIFYWWTVGGAAPAATGSLVGAVVALAVWSLWFAFSRSRRVA